MPRVMMPACHAAMLPNGKGDETVVLCSALTSPVPRTLVNETPNDDDDDAVCAHDDDDTT